MTADNPQIPIVDGGKLWCSCDTAMPQSTIPPACPTCGRATDEILREAEYNGRVMAFIDAHPLDWGLPGVATKTEWWAQMAAAYEADLASQPPVPPVDGTSIS